ncbi:MAG: histidine--tRNA ligase [Burkholderiaceae bacterium]
MSQRSEKDEAALRAVKGMNDVLPADEALWERFEDAATAVARAYGYKRIRTPILEHAALFSRGIGKVTDIVEKEMYAFEDKADKDGNREYLALRPESTASVVRAAIEHNLLYDGPQRLWNLGPMFRRERPQRGRTRQFHQFDIEALGFAGPDIDAEVILLAKRLFDDLGIENLRLEINTIGQPDERAAHRVALIEYLEANDELLDADAKRRLHTNPLRILDTKNPDMQALVEAAPRISDFIGDATRALFEGLKSRLTDAGVEFRVNPRLVRGLDYYNLTVFEWITDALGAQGTVCGGGRYDPLVAMLGGKPTPACGFAIGIERILELLRAQEPDTIAACDISCDVYLVHQGEAASRLAMRVAEGLRTVGLDVILHCAGANAAASFKSQMKRADASGAAFAVILGDDEVAANEATVKPLVRDAAGNGAARGEHGREQMRLSLAALAEWLVDALVANDDESDEESDNANDDAPDEDPAAPSLQTLH